MEVSVLWRCPYYRGVISITEVSLRRGLTVPFYIHTSSFLAMPSFATATKLSIKSSFTYKVRKHSGEVITSCYFLDTRTVI